MLFAYSGPVSAHEIDGQAGYSRTPMASPFAEVTLEMAMLRMITLLSFLTSLDGACQLECLCSVRELKSTYSPKPVRTTEELAPTSVVLLPILTWAASCVIGPEMMTTLGSLPATAATKLS